MSTQTASKRPVTLVEPGTVRLERLLPGPLERVWARKPKTSPSFSNACIPSCEICSVTGWRRKAAKPSSPASSSGWKPKAPRSNDACTGALRSIVFVVEGIDPSPNSPVLELPALVASSGGMAFAAIAAMAIPAIAPRTPPSTPWKVDSPTIWRTIVP